MPENPDQEWRRLTENYAEMYDEQLLDLAASFNDLTDMAKTVLRDEVRKRGLGDPLSPDFAALAQGRADAEQALNAAESEAAEKPVDYTWKVELCECNDSVEASQIAEVLRRAGLDSWVQTPRYAGDMLGPKVMVAADQLEGARAVIANPIPQDIVQASLEQIPEYTPPVCPACGAADPILLAADPSNSWECEACGKEWSDPAEDHSEAH